MPLPENTTKSLDFVVFSRFFSFLHPEIFILIFMPKLCPISHSVVSPSGIRYCFLLGIIQKHPNRIKKVSRQLREDLIKLNRYIAEAKLLLANKIETMENLAA